MINLKKAGQMPFKSVEAAKQEFNTTVQQWERMDITHHLHGDTLHLIARSEIELAQAANRHHNRGYH